MDRGATSGPDLTVPLVLAAGLAAAVAAGAHVGGGGGALGPAVAIVGLLGAALAARMPLLGLFGIVFATASNLSDTLIVYWGLPSINRLLAPGLAFILLARLCLFGERPFTDRRATLACVGFLLLYASSIPHAHDHAVVLDGLDGNLRTMILVLLTLALFNQPGAFRLTTATLVFFGAASSLAGLYKLAAGDPTNDFGGFVRTIAGNRFAGSHPDPNYFGALLAMMLPLAAHRAFFAVGLPGRVWGYVAMAALVAGVLMTHSRGALVALAAGALCYAPMLDRRLVLRLSAFAAVAVVVAGAALSEEIIARFASIFAVADVSAPRDINVEGRLGAWKAAIDMFLSHPLFGVGGGNFSTLYQTTANELGLIFRGEGRSAHSLYLEILAEFGLVGMAFFMAVIGGAIAGPLRAMATLRARGETLLWAECGAFLAALVTYLVALVFLHDTGSRQLWLLLVVGLALPNIMAVELAARVRARPDRGGGAAAAPWRRPAVGTGVRPADPPSRRDAPDRASPTPGLGP